MASILNVTFSERTSLVYLHKISSIVSPNGQCPTHSLSVILLWASYSFNISWFMFVYVLSLFIKTVRAKRIQMHIGLFTDDRYP